MIRSDLSPRGHVGARSVGLRGWVFAVAFLVFVASVAVGTPRASAIGDAEELARFGSEGSAAGQVDLPFGLATDPTTGHVYVAAGGSTNRIDEFTAWGKFVKAFGWDVAPGPVNEQQEVRVKAGAGEFKLGFESSTTGDLAFDAPGSESEGPGSVEAALNALPSIAFGGGSVSVSEVAGNPNGTVPYVYVVVFRGSLAAKNVDQLVTSNGETQLSGGSPSTDIEARTRANGTIGGVGLESCTVESGCQAGLGGSGAGEFNTGDGLAVDAAGDIYVKERGNHRVQRFHSDGSFVSMFGGDVDKSTGGNLCTAASKDECGVGTPGSGPSEFSEGFNDGITLSPAGALFVADNERIERFNLQGEFEASIPVDGKAVSKLAFDPASGDLYAVFESEINVHQLSTTTGKEVSELRVNGAGAVTTDLAGSVYVTGSTGSADTVFQFDSSGNPLTPSSCCEAPLLAPPNPEADRFRINALAANTAGDIYLANDASGRHESFIRSFGPAPVMFEAPPKVPPMITGQFASSVQRDGATVSAEINPHFWTDTRYYVQYGTGKCSEGGCEEEKSIPPGAILSSNVIDASVRSAGVFLEGLKAGTTYHYRFVAQSGGGGPVFGVDPDGEGPKLASAEDGLEATFMTFPERSSQPTCSNDVLRTGASSSLPDCRAYEMVSPLDKNNGDVTAPIDFFNFTTALDQSSEDGDEFTYSSYRSFADPSSAPYTSQYLASRGSSTGWSNVNVSPPGLRENGAAESLYKAFSANLCQSWLIVTAEPSLTSNASQGFPNLYRRDNCGGNGYEALVNVRPSSTGEFNLDLQGTSTDGKQAVFRVKSRLVPAQVGSQLECATSGGATTISYQWRRNGIPIAGATASLYTIVGADEGKTVQCQVTATNVNAGSTQVANPAVSVEPLSEVAPPVAPREIATPTSDAPLTVGGEGGQTLFCDAGEAGWGGAPSFSYQWYRDGVSIDGATTSVYVVKPGDLATAAVFQCAVSATNAGGIVTDVSRDLPSSPSPSAPTPPQADASMPSNYQTYYANKGEIQLLCVLPDGKPSVGNCSAGTIPGNLHSPEINRVANVGNAISDEGTRVYWTLSESASGAGEVYLRENPGQAQSALNGEECVEVEKACTVKVSETKSTKAARFLYASADGSKALFEVTEGPLAGKLYKFELDVGSSEIAGRLVGLAGASQDLSYVYFVSEEALGGAAKIGEPNLYVSHEGTTSFIATLSKTDVTSTLVSSDIAVEPIYHAARASADGRRLAFISTARPTDYDNTDLTSGEPDSEVYIYEAGASKPMCISCNPSGARPQGRNAKGTDQAVGFLETAGSIPPATYQLYLSRALSADGERLFFDSYDALLPRDINGAEDVYEWEAASSQQDCVEKGADLYAPSAGGCIGLISSGESPQDSEFLDASLSGDDVFFTTNASLLPQDAGLIDVYDARVDGGFPQPVAPAACEGEACQSPPAPPIDATPGSLTFSGAGNATSQLLAVVKPKAKVLTRAQMLTKALKACGLKPRRRRTGCRAQAHKRYAIKKAKRATSNRRAAR